MTQSSRQRRIDELAQPGVYDPSGATPGSAAPPAPTPDTPAAPAAPAPKSKPEPAPGSDELETVENIITAADAIATAANNLETASVYLRNAKGDHSTGEDLDKLRATLLQISTTVREKLIGASEDHPRAAERVRAWLEQGTNREPGPSLSSPASPVPPASAPAPAAQPAAAPSAQGAVGPPRMESKNPCSKDGECMDPNDEDFGINYGEPTQYGYVFNKKLGRWMTPMESLETELDSALSEDGVTKHQGDAGQTGKQKTEVIQREKTGTHPKHWYTAGAKGNGYGSGGKFNNT